MRPATTASQRETIAQRAPYRRRDTDSIGTAAPALLLFASGAAALVFQVLWIKQLSLVVGIDVYAVTIGVSAFFAGLALGGYVLGRWADRIRRPFLFYAALELGIGVLAVAATFGLAHAAQPFTALEQRVGLFAWILPFALVGLPAIPIGGTFPAVVLALNPRAGKIGRAGGGVYAANTAGAIVGALASVFLLIPVLGVRGAAVAAALVNLSVAAGALYLNRIAQPRASVVRPLGPIRLSSEARLALVLYSLAGAIALGYEVVWSQAIVQFLSTRSFAFAIVLATYLGGLAVGAALYTRWADRVRDPWGVFGLLIAAAGVLAIVEIALLGRWLVYAQTLAEAGLLALGGSHLAGMCTRFAVASFSIVFLPTVLLGAAFPFAVRLIVQGDGIGRDVGAVLALNTLGGIVGTMLTGFVLVPVLGLVHTLGLLAIIAAGVGVMAAMTGTGVKRGARRVAIAFGIAALAYAVFTPADRLASLLPGARNGTLLFYEESRGGTVAVVQSQTGRNEFRRLYIQGVSNSGDAMPSLRYMRLQALLPLIIHVDEPRAALVIGLGTGITAGALTSFPGLEQRVCAELLPAVVRAAPLFHGNFGAGLDPAIEIRLRDGRRELLRSSDRYDLVTLEPPPPSAAGVVNLYSTEFYVLAAKRLRPRGLIAQWLPLPAQNDEDSRSLVRSFLDVFPHASLWTTEFHEMLLIGSLEPMELDAQRIAARFNERGVARALRDVGIGSPAALLATWVTDRDGLERYAADAPAVTDDRPRIEYATWVRAKEVTRVLPRLLELRTDPPLRNADPALLAALADERQRLLTFYDAALHAYEGDRELWARDLKRVLEQDRNNPYYRWVSGGAH